MCLLICTLGHVRRLLQGIGELTEMMKSGPQFPSSVNVPQPQSLETSLVPAPLAHAPPSPPSNNTPSPVEEPILPPPQNWSSGNPEKVDFDRMKGLLEMKMGVNRLLENNSEEHVVGAVPPLVPRQDGQFPTEREWVRSHEDPSHLPPQLPPKKNRKPLPSHQVAARGIFTCDYRVINIHLYTSFILIIPGRDELDSSEGKTFSVEDITAALGVSINM